MAHFVADAGSGVVSNTVSTPANEVEASLKDAPFEATSVENEPTIPDRGLETCNKQVSCSDATQLGKDTNALDSSCEVAHVPHTDLGRSRDVSGTDYTCSEVDTTA